MASLPVFAACGTDAIGVAACKQIEQARCRQAPACGVPLDTPLHAGGTDVDACIRYYDVACLHGLTVEDPGAPKVRACVDAINANPCGTYVDGGPPLIVDPTQDVHCSWLIPPAPAPAVDASVDASDAPAEAASGDATGN